jgi:hypothetical protein
MSRASFLVAVIVALFLSTIAPAGAWPAVSRFLPGDLDPRTEILLDATTVGLPSEFAVVGVTRWALQPGPKPLIVPPHGGLVLVKVERGQLIATQHGVETRLLAGEIFAPDDDTREVILHVRGSDEAVIVVVGFQALGFTADCAWGSDTLIQIQQLLIRAPAHALPEESVRLHLERVTVPPGSALPPQEVSPLMWTSVGEGMLGMTLEGQMPFLWEPGQERTLYRGQAWPQIPDPIINPLMSGGTRMTLRNAGDDPLVLYRLTLTPSGGEIAPPASPLGGAPLF